MAVPVADLEISLQRCDSPAAPLDPGDLTTPGPVAAGAPAPETRSYSIEMRLSTPNSDADIRTGVDHPVTTTLNFDQLRALSGDSAGYAQALSASFFADADFRTSFLQAMAVIQAGSMALRVRLLSDYEAPELLNLRWETLLDPAHSAPLFTGQGVYFSRFLVSRDWRPVQLLPKGDLRALVAVAAPSGLDTLRLGAIDTPLELGIAKTGLGGVPLTTLTSAPADSVASAGATPPAGSPASAGAAPPPDRCTLDRLVALLRGGTADGKPFDILYLVCHGAYIQDEPWLVLENEDGSIARVRGVDLVTRVNELDNRPRLVVLASCQSAGISAGQALTALGPRLAEAGVPAVLAMQGSVAQATVEKFMPVFFSELVKDGQIDRAMSVARGAVRDAPDYWMPVLFMRLKSGRLWYVPGFGEDGATFQKWASLVANLKRKQGTPIIGPGIIDSIIGSVRDIAAKWADQYHYPLGTNERDSLPQVAQYLSIQQDQNFPRYQLIDFLRAQVIERYGGDLNDALKTPGASLDDMLEAVVQARIVALEAQGMAEPFKLLASLPLPIYITTNFSNLLAAALKAAGKDPKVVICPWNDLISQSADSLDPNYRPSDASPLVYHLFGRFDNPDSLVLTEDDYFDFLIGVTKNADLIPSFVRTALTASSLLFIGFRLDEWDFRVLFRSINDRGGAILRRRFISVGVQVDQEGSDIVDPDRARNYLESYFDDAFINLYWGSVDDFIQDLAQQLKSNP